ncbi:MAG: hypothetical protein CMI09_12925 [Oceanospirillaceae bacterium]|nr:hypothetical protein [Oceanospirillaceae bacterium]
MAEFYVDRTATQGEDHIVHKAVCDQLPPMETLFYIGSYASADAASNIAKGYFPSVATCKDCIPA